MARNGKWPRPWMNCRAADGRCAKGRRHPIADRAPGFDAPDFLVAGPRDVLVPSSLVEEAKQVLEDTTGLGSYAP